MTRVVALVVLILLLVFTGFWLARRPLGGRPAAASGDATKPAATAAATAAPSQAPSQAPRQAAGGASAAGTPAASAAVTLPPGYTALAYLTSQRRLVFDKAQQVLKPGTDYVAVLVTSKGDITIRLLAQEAPRTVNNFVFLALNRFYNGVPFHRVLAGFMAQTGDPTGTGRGGPGYTFADEISPDLEFDKRGVVAMANRGPNTNGSQFFITFAATPWLDGHYSIFGQVIAGDAVLSKLQRIDPQKPEAVVSFSETLGTLSSKGVTLAGARNTTVGDALAHNLGARPVVGQSFSIGSYLGVVGTSAGKPAVAFYPRPDTLERVVIGTKPAS
jgi:cyclophilin family peptidyl-prolyl cis-trans isomerase